MSELVNKKLIFDFLAGNVTALQRKLIDEWYRDPIHEELFYEWLDEWERTHLQYAVDKQDGLDRYREFLSASRSAGALSINNTDELSGDGSRRNWIVWLVAASVAFIIGGWLFREQLLNHTYATGYGQTSSVTLPDGSQVTLNANSTLRVPRFGFGGQTRKVWLAGEALFSIIHTKTHKRFVVTTDNSADVVVLGTEFTLFARPRATKVVLHRGKVEFKYQAPDLAARQITMKPGDRVDLSADGMAQLSQVSQPANASAWRDHRFVFDKTSLRDVAYLFQENFGINIDLADAETAALTLSGSFPAQSADELLEIIAEALNIRIIRQDGKVVLTPKPL